ncbi:Glucosidase II beta subunit-like protein [Gracilaria domingensis]|nr:Glucosidase II beta subunit-like protein [Gracilaria domingensis]
MSLAVATFLLISLLLLSLSNCVHICVLRDAPDLPAQPLPDHRINDDYCDCADASDENRTSACSNGFFTCQNVQYRPVQIYSSWVHDGSCDCCDGSDEPPGACPDTCAALRAADLKEATQKADIVRRGIATRKSYVRDVERNSKTEMFELKKLEKQLASIERQLNSHEKRAEVLRKRRDWENGMKQTTSYESDRSSSSYDAPPAEPDHEHDHDYDYEDDEYRDFDDEPEYDTHDGDDGDNDDVLDDGDDIDEDSYVGEDGHVEEDSEVVPEVPADTEATADPAVEEQPSEPRPSAENEPAATSAETQDVEPEKVPEPSDTVDVDSLCAELESSSPNWFVRRVVYFRTLMLSKVRRFLPEKLISSMGTQSADLSNCISKADQAKWDLDSKKREIQKKIDDLKKKDSIDFGADNALRKLYGSCTKGKVTQYEFEMCMFDTVRQYENGASIAQLGRFSGWEGEGKDRVMMFSEGDRCWNGPQRSIEVELLCSDKEEVVSVDEPNRCTYRMKFKTPAVCEEYMVEEIMADFSNAGNEEKQEL